MLRPRLESRIGVRKEAKEEHQEVEAILGGKKVQRCDTGTPTAGVASSPSHQQPQLFDHKGNLQLNSGRPRSQVRHRQLTFLSEDQFSMRGL